MILFFTATGNNLHIAKKLGGELYSIPRCIKENRFEFEDEKIGIVFPVYYIKVPQIIEQFLGKAKLKSQYIYAVLSYGYYSGAASSHLLEAGKRNGIDFSYINEIIMVDNYLPGFDMAKQAVNEPKKNIEANLNKIIADVNGQKRYINKNSIPRKLSAKFIDSIFLPAQDRLLFKDVHRFDNNFIVENGCTACGICVKVCPVDNIKMNDNKPAYQGNCIRCLACIHHCPQNVIHLKCEKSKARFINKNIKLAEIIKAND